MMQIPDVKKGEAPKADQQNLLIEKVNGLLDQKHSDTVTSIALFKLTGAPVVPSGSGASYSSEPTIYATAKRMWYKLNSTADSYMSYQVESGDAEPKIWFPAATADSNGWGESCGVGNGQLVWATFNRQSERWEAIETVRAPLLAWATTSADVLSTASTFTVTSIVPMDGSTWTGDDPLTVSNNPDAFSLDSGTTGKIMYCKDPTGDDWSWHPLDFACCSDCECECST